MNHGDVVVCISREGPSSSSSSIGHLDREVDCNRILVATREIDSRSGNRIGTDRDAKNGEWIETITLPYLLQRQQR